MIQIDDSHGYMTDAEFQREAEENPAFWYAYQGRPSAKGKQAEQDEDAPPKERDVAEEDDPPPQVVPVSERGACRGGRPSLSSN
jgi:hypothetical protein